MIDDDMMNDWWWYDYLLYYSCIPIYVMMWIITPLLLFMYFLCLYPWGIDIQNEKLYLCGTLRRWWWGYTPVVFLVFFVILSSRINTCSDL